MQWIFCFLSRIIIDHQNKTELVSWIANKIVFVTWYFVLKFVLTKIAK